MSKQLFVVGHVIFKTSLGPLESRSGVVYGANDALESDSVAIIGKSTLKALCAVHRYSHVPKCLSDGCCRTEGQAREAINRLRNQIKPRVPHCFQHDGTPSCDLENIFKLSGLRELCCQSSKVSGCSHYFGEYVRSKYVHLASSLCIVPILDILGKPSRNRIDPVGLPAKENNSRGGEKRYNYVPRLPPHVAVLRQWRALCNSLNPAHFLIPLWICRNFAMGKNQSQEACDGHLLPSQCLKLTKNLQQTGIGRHAALVGAALVVARAEPRSRPSAKHSIRRVAQDLVARLVLQHLQAPTVGFQHRARTLEIAIRAAGSHLGVVQLHCQGKEEVPGVRVRTRQKLAGSVLRCLEEFSAGSLVVGVRRHGADRMSRQSQEVSCG